MAEVHRNGLPHLLLWLSHTTEKCRQRPQRQSLPFKLIAWSRINQYADRFQREARGRGWFAQLLLPNSQIKQVPPSMGREKASGSKRWKDPYSATDSSTWKHGRPDESLPSTKQRGKFAIFVRTGIGAQRGHNFLGIFTSFLELSCDVEFTLHFSFQHKDNLFFYSNGAIRIQL